MNIAYVSHARFPTPKAYGKQIAEVCYALSALGHAVTVLSPTVHRNVHTEAERYYGLPKTYAVEHLKHFDPTAHWWIPGKLWALLQHRIFGRAVQRYIATSKPDLVYIRSPHLLHKLLSTGANVIIELHDLPRRNKQQFVVDCNRVQKVVCLTTLMKQELLQWGVEESQMIVEGDGVCLERFSALSTEVEARARYELPKTKPIIGYVGSLTTRNTVEKGVKTLIDALVVLKKRGISVFGFIVGGPEYQVEEYKQYAKEQGLHESEVRFQGPVPAEEVASAMSACSVLVYPAPASDHPYFMRDTSPLKLFEYFATGKPVVCASIPPLADVVDEALVTPCEPGSAQSTADAVSAVLSDLRAATDKARYAQEYNQRFDWQKRMERILSSL